MALNSKEQKRSIILCTEKDFRIRSVNTLIDCALAGDKFHFEKLVDAREKFLTDEKIEVFVVNGADSQARDVIAHMAVFEELYKGRPRTNFIVFISKDQKEEITAQASNFPHCNIFIGTVNKRDLNSVINPIRSSQTTSTVSPLFGKANPPADAKKTAELNQAFMEASAHVRDTVAAMGELSKDRSNLAKLEMIGQRFNGFVGTFAFVEGKEGYTQLMQLATIIDEITRHYNPTTGHKEISAKHFDMMLDAAKCSYLMLKELRENRLPKNEQLTQFLGIITEYATFTEIKRLNKANQEEIDQLLKAL